MTDKITIVLDNNTNIEVPSGTTLFELAQYYQKEMNNPILGAKINNQIIPLDEKLTQDTVVTFFDINDLAGYKMYQAGLKMVLEVALKEQFGPETGVYFSHSVARGMIANIESPTLFGTNEVRLLKQKMAEIIMSNDRIYKFNTYKKDAINYYNENKEYEKSQNIHNNTNEIITYYRLRNLYRYYYIELPFSTGVLTKFELVYLNNNRLVVLFPSPRTQNAVPEYVHYANVIKTFDEGKNWLDKMEVPYLANINEIIGDNNIEKFIKASEIEFDIKINKVVEEIIANKNIKCVMIAGPSSSGKTTSTKKLALNFMARGYHPIVISVDDYFLDRKDTPKDKDGNYDFESIKSIDLKLLNEQLVALANHETIKRPTYNFLTGKKEFGDETLKLEEDGIILMEGLHCLNDELTPAIDGNAKYKIYLSPFIPLNIDRHNYISTTDLRLLRRMVRDNRTRGNDVSKTIGYWQSVRQGEEKYIFPYIHQANVVINTALTYELNALRVYAEPLLYSVRIDSPYYEEARRLINFLQLFFPVPSEFVPKDSVLREFMGNGTFE